MKNNYFIDEDLIFDFKGEYDMKSNIEHPEYFASS